MAPAAEARELLAAEPTVDQLEGWLARRADGEPLAWLTGVAPFAGRRLHAAPGTYVPRPQSEELAHRAAAVLPPRGRALDLCAGIGAVAAVLRSAAPAAAVVAIDHEPRAVRCARRNGLMAVVADVDAPVAAGAFDVVTAIAPYVPRDQLALLPSDIVRHEPRGALDGGPDGLAVVRRVVATAARVLRPGGHLLVELGADQDALLGPALRSAFADVVVWHDEEGDLRGLQARRRLAT